MISSKLTTVFDSPKPTPNVPIDTPKGNPMMNILSVSRSKFCSQQETKAVVVLGGVMVAGLAESAVAGNAIRTGRYDSSMSTTIQCSYNYTSGYSDCSSLHTYEHVFIGENETLQYEDRYHYSPDSEDYEPGLCYTSSQSTSMYMGLFANADGTFGAADFNLTSHTTADSFIVSDWDHRITHSLSGRTSLQVTDFIVGNVRILSPSNSPSAVTVGGPELSINIPGYYQNLVMWPGEYVFTVNTSMEFFQSGVGSPDSNFRTLFALNLEQESIFDAPPPCTGSNRCADYNNDGNFDLSDLFGWYASPIDVTGDKLFDADPYSDDASWIAGMLLATDDTLNDCNENGFPDVYDIFIGSPFGGSDDTNSDGIPDECQIAACPADLTGDGALNFFDVSAFLSAFGNNNPIADFTGDGLFNFFDVSAFLQAFSAGCP